jgi:hypothetical protein
VGERDERGKDEQEKCERAQRDDSPGRVHDAVGKAAATAMSSG